MKASRSPLSASLARLKNSQVFVVCVLAAARFSAPFFFCLGFLASRLDRFCSLFATVLSLHVGRRRICCRCAAIQPLNFPPAPYRRFVQRLNAMSYPRGHSGGEAANKYGLHVLLDPSVVVTRLMTGAPRTKRLILSAISFQRRSTMPLVHPELCGVAITFGNS
jgi:hypothetical protein